MRVVLNFDITLKDWTIGSRDMIFLVYTVEFVWFKHKKYQILAPDLAGLLAEADPEPEPDVLHVHLLADQESGCIVSYIILILLE